jgi:hypothetical protein
MARVGMDSLIQRVRDHASCGESDYTIGVTSYWTDDQIQGHLDRNRESIRDEQLSIVSTVAADGTTEYYEYFSTAGNYEESTGGTAVLYLRDGTGSRISIGEYTPDYNNGRFVFAANTAGTVLYLTGESYDVEGAAADVWEQKAAHVADRFDFTADGASFTVSQMIRQYKDQAARLRAMSPSSGISSHTLQRSDIVA